MENSIENDELKEFRKIVLDIYLRQPFLSEGSHTMKKMRDVLTRFGYLNKKGIRTEKGKKISSNDD